MHKWEKVSIKRVAPESLYNAHIAITGWVIAILRNIKTHVNEQEIVFITNMVAWQGLWNKLAGMKPNVSTSRSKRCDAPYAKNGNHQAHPTAQVNVNYGYTSVSLA